VKAAVLEEASVLAAAVHQLRWQGLDRLRPALEVGTPPAGPDTPASRVPPVARGKLRLERLPETSDCIFYLLTVAADRARTAQAPLVGSRRSTVRAATLLDTLAQPWAPESPPTKQPPTLLAEMGGAPPQRRPLAGSSGLCRPFVNPQLSQRRSLHAGLARLLTDWGLNLCQAALAKKKGRADTRLPPSLRGVFRSTRLGPDSLVAMASAASGEYSTYVSFRRIVETP
jgi:hypothetical protein